MSSYNAVIMAPIEIKSDYGKRIINEDVKFPVETKDGVFMVIGEAGASYPRLKSTPAGRLKPLDETAINRVRQLIKKGFQGDKDKPEQGIEVGVGDKIKSSDGKTVFRGVGAKES